MHSQRSIRPGAATNRRLPGRFPRPVPLQGSFLLLLCLLTQLSISQVQELVLPQSISFPHGFDIIHLPAAGASVIKTVPGPISVDVKAWVEGDDSRYFMSAWSWHRAQQGESAHWMRPLIAPAPAALPAFEVAEYERLEVFEKGYDLVTTPGDAAEVRPGVDGPISLRVLADVTVDREIYFLDGRNHHLWKNGQPHLWLRPRFRGAGPGQIQAIERALEEAGFTLAVDRWSAAHPWLLSQQLFSTDPQGSRALLRLFPVDGLLPDIASMFEDQEFPGSWLSAVARDLGDRDGIAQAIQQLRDYQPRRQVSQQLYRGAEQEMEAAYAEDEILFDQRLIALLEAARANWEGAEQVLQLLAGEWDPANQGLNASGPMMNLLRDLAQARWKLGRVPSATEDTRRWLDAYARDLAHSLLHPDYVDAAQRVMEFDSDFEATGGYFDLLGSITDPLVAAGIVVGLKGLRLAVEASQQVRTSVADPGLASLAAELERLKRQADEVALRGEELDLETEDRLAELHAALALRRLSGTAFELRNEPSWRRLTGEINRRQKAGEDIWDYQHLVEERELIALQHLVEKGGFIATPAEVQECLQQGEWLVDFFRTPGEDSWNPGLGGTYGAVLLSSDGQVRLAGLGEAGRIDRFVDEVRSLMQASGSYAGLSPEALEAAVAPLLSEGYRLLIDPVQKLLGNARRWVICPEGQLCFLPFEILQDSAGRSLASTHDVTYVNAARDLRRSDTAPPGDNRLALLVGNPDYKAQPSSRAITESTSEPDDVLRDALTRAARNLAFLPLPGSEREVRDLASLLQEAGYGVEVLTSHHATEPALTSRKGSPVVLHLATHGFFLSGLPGSSPSGSSRPGATLLSGLALAGAQSTIERWSRGIIPPTDSDGILLAADVARLDLTSTELVVLSACETALGDQLRGEGVEGLRSALTLAGARHVVLTLWPVGDEATAELMFDFYQRYLAGRPVPMALREAKSALLARYEANYGRYTALRLIAPFLTTRSGRL